MNIILALSLTMSGVGSWYGPGFLNHKTANGEIFRADTRQCAMLTMPFGSVVSIYNPETRRSSWCVVVDRGPYWDNRIIDVNERVSKELGYFGGIAKLILHITTPSHLAKADLPPMPKTHRIPIVF
jgi:rare lipoprotein A